MDKEEYQKSIRKQHREGETALCCSTCGENDSSIIEMRLCRNAHLNNICNLDIPVKVMH